VIRDRPTLIVRDDALLNPNGLRDLGQAQISAPATPGRVSESDLGAARFVIAGQTPAPYLPPVDTAQLHRALQAGGFRPVMQRRFGRYNAIVVWGRTH
jgi:hypothetical protein